MSFTYKYKLVTACVENITRICRKIPRGSPKLYMARGKPTIPPPTHVLKIASAP